jgi:hypothetical protein
MYIEYQYLSICISLDIRNDSAHFIEIYIKYLQVWGSDPTERYRLSLGRLLDESQELVVPFTVSGENCRGFVKCEVCLKPTCYYAQ